MEWFRQVVVAIIDERTKNKHIKNLLLKTIIDEVVNGLRNFFINEVNENEIALEVLLGLIQYINEADIESVEDFAHNLYGVALLYTKSVVDNHKCWNRDFSTYFKIRVEQLKKIEHTAFKHELEHSVSVDLGFVDGLIQHYAPPGQYVTYKLDLLELKQTNETTPSHLEGPSTFAENDSGDDSLLPIKKSESSLEKSGENPAKGKPNSHSNSTSVASYLRNFSLLTRTEELPTDNFSDQNGLSM